MLSTCVGANECLPCRDRHLPRRTGAAGGAVVGCVGWGAGGYETCTRAQMCIVTSRGVGGKWWGGMGVGGCCSGGWGVRRRHVGLGGRWRTGTSKGACGSGRGPLLVHRQKHEAPPAGEAGGGDERGVRSTKGQLGTGNATCLHSAHTSPLPSAPPATAGAAAPTPSRCLQYVWIGPTPLPRVHLPIHSRASCTLAGVPPLAWACTPRTATVRQARSGRAALLAQPPAATQQPRC